MKIQIDKDNSFITFEEDSAPKNSISVSKAEEKLIRNHPKGCYGFKYVNGKVVASAARESDYDLNNQRNEAIKHNKHIAMEEIIKAKTMATITKIKMMSNPELRNFDVEADIQGK